MSTNRAEPTVRAPPTTHRHVVDRRSRVRVEPRSTRYRFEPSNFKKLSVSLQIENKLHHRPPLNKHQSVEYLCCESAPTLSQAYMTYTPQSVHDEPLTLHDTRLARTLHSAQTAMLECSMQLQCEWKDACRRVCNVGVLVCVQCGTTRFCHGCVGALQLLMCVLLDKLAPVLCGAGDVCHEAVQGRCRDRGTAPVGNTREAWESRRGVITRRGASASRHEM